MDMIALPRSVTVTGIVHLLALALAPEPSLSAPSRQALQAESSGAADRGLVSAGCPYGPHAASATWSTGVHPERLAKPLASSAESGWRSGKLTVF